MPDLLQPLLAFLRRLRPSSSSRAGAPSPPSVTYKLLRDDSTPRKGTCGTRRTRFFDASGDGRVVYSATHAVSRTEGGWETALELEGQPVGRVSLHWLQVGGIDGKIPARSFYRDRGCFNLVAAFQLESDWVSWKTAKDGSMALTSIKDGSTLIAVDPLEHDKALILPPKSRITLFSRRLFPPATSSVAVSPPVRPGLPSSPPPSFTSTSPLPLPSPPLPAPSQSSALAVSPQPDGRNEQLELVLLTLLHQDYVRVEEVRRRHEVEEEREEHWAW
ncbi:hypothetical protein JCM10450v2_000039 [Rhodotorula kratochvilovae]